MRRTAVFRDRADAGRKLAGALKHYANEPNQPFYAVGAWYGDFSQTTDEEVRELLRLANESARRA